MEPISNAAVRPPAPAAGVRTPPEAEREAAPAAPARPARDLYVPEEKRPSAGLYRMGRDEEGKPKICFDAPEEGPKKRTKAERCTANTDKVDRELEKLREKRAELERQLRAEADGTKSQELERKLAGIESELRQKDNDAYRRQHAVFS